MPREARRLDLAIARCSRLAQQQQIRRAGRAEIQKAYEQWRENFIKRPLAELKKESQALQRPLQQPERQRLEQSRQRLSAPDVPNAVALFQRGYQALLAQPSGDSKTTEILKPWLPRQEDLVDPRRRPTP
jgi:hypothetical protein